MKFTAMTTTLSLSLLAGAGVIGIAVGFAARDTLANLISGVSIVADAPYKLGDYIVLDTGERGVVSSLGIRSTRLMTRDDVEVSIPNAVIGSAKIINESGGPWEKYRIRIPVGVAYGSDTELAHRLMLETARELLAGPHHRLSGNGHRHRCTVGNCPAGQRCRPCSQRRGRVATHRPHGRCPARGSPRA